MNWIVAALIVAVAWIVLADAVRRAPSAVSVAEVVAVLGGLFLVKPGPLLLAAFAVSAVLFGMLQRPRAEVAA